MSNTVLDLLLQRRSVKLLGVPGPTEEQLKTLLTAAARVPDHKAVTPWRFVVIDGDARESFGAMLAEVLMDEEKEPPSPVRLETERQRMMAAPVTVAVISRVKDVPGAPEWEQLLSCGAACQNLVVAANAMGFGCNWVTRWFAYSEGVRARMGLASSERIAGFIHIGTALARQPERKRPALDEVVSRWKA